MAFLSLLLTFLLSLTTAIQTASAEDGVWIGALAFEMNPLCDYQGAEPGIDNYGSGMVFTAEIQELGPLPESEVAETRHFDTFPAELTYPRITRAILGYTPAKNPDENNKKLKSG